MIYDLGVYAFKPDNLSSHMKIIKYINNSGNKKFKVLDIGCCTGFIGKKLNNTYELYGIDSIEENVKIAKKYYREVKMMDLDIKRPSYKKKFDFIIMADILEHLKNPLKIIQHFKKFLKKNGRIIISLPNVANIYVRLNLLFGKFDYRQKGILDNTHLRFFTLKSFRKIVRQADLIVEKEDFTPIPLPTLNPIFLEGRLLSFVHKINYCIAFLWKKMFAFQFIFYCKKN